MFFLHHRSAVRRAERERAYMVGALRAPRNDRRRLRDVGPDGISALCHRVL